MSYEVDLAVKDKYGFQPLHRAAGHGTPSMITQILDKRPDLINVQDKDRDTPLDYAIYNYEKENAQLIKQRGGKTNSETYPNDW